MRHAARRARPQPRCRDLQQLEEVLAKSRSYDELLDAWAGWHTISREMRPLYERLVTLGNEGAQEIGVPGPGRALARRLRHDARGVRGGRRTASGREVKPLYDELHCYVRGPPARSYGEGQGPRRQAHPGAPARQHVGAGLGEPLPAASSRTRAPGSLDVDAALKKQKYDAVRMVKLGEAFFTSLGLDPLPETFWERSLFMKPRDREVVCHASAWDVTFDDDLRIKMCIQPTEEDLVTIHHELGHNYYQHAYVQLPVLFQDGANDGFHEAHRRRARALRHARAT